MSNKMLAVAMESHDSIAKEGFVSRTKNFFSRVFTSEETIAKYLSSLKAPEAKETQELKDVAWSRVFFDNYSEVNAGTIVKLIETTDRYTKALTQEASKALVEIKKFESHMTTGQVAGTIEKFEKMEADIADKYPLFNIKKVTGNVTTGNAQEVEKVIKATLGTITGNKTQQELHNVLAQLDDILFNFYKFEENTAGDTIDNVALRVASEAADTIFDRAFSCIRYRTRIIHGAYMFVRESVK